MSSTRRIIHQSTELTVVYAECGSDTVFVTFNEMERRASGDYFWGDEVFRRLNISAVGFVSARPNWFPNREDMAVAIDAALASIAGRRVVTYGFSQGGYGALKFGSRLSASLAIGFGPQWSINPDDVGDFDRRFITHYDKSLRNGEKIEQADLCPKNIIFVDRSHKQDVFNAEKLLEMSRVSLVTSPFSGHGTIQVLTEGGKGSMLIRRCADSRSVDHLELRQLMRAARRTSRAYQTHKFQRLIQCCPRHSGFLRISLAELPESTEKSLIIIAKHLKEKRNSLARSEFDAIKDEDLLAADFHNYWETFRNQDFSYGESRIAFLYKIRYKDSVHVRLHGVNSMIKTGFKSAALEELETLEQLNGAADNARFFCDFYRQIDRLDKAVAFFFRLPAERNLKLDDQIRLGFDLLGWSFSADRMANLDAQLMRLREMSRNNFDHEISLVDAAIAVDRSDFALSLIESYSERLDEPAILKVYRTQFLVSRDLPQAKRNIEQLLNTQQGEFRFWMKLGQAAEAIVGPRAAATAMRRALSECRPAADVARTRNRLVQYSVQCGDFPTAISELTILFDSPEAYTNRAYEFASLANRAGNLDLAVRFAGRWLTSDANSAAAHLTYCYYLSQADDMKPARESLVLLTSRIESKELTLTASEFDTLINLATEIDFGLGQRAAQLALEAYPHESRFSDKISNDPFVKLFYRSEPATGQGKVGLLGRLGLTFGKSSVWLNGTRR